LFQKLSFEVVVKPRKMNIGPDHLSLLESGENGGAIDDHLPDADLFKIEVVPDYLSHISLFFSNGVFPDGYSATKKRHLVVHATNYQFIAG
jgi:hypothetical protein